MVNRKCFFCDIQKQDDEKQIASNAHFVARYDDYPVKKGHALVFPKKHIESFFELTDKQVVAMYELITKVCGVINTKFNPNGFNIGLNEGKAAGQSIDHLHIHLIPRYIGDVADPMNGGIRNVFAGKGNYFKDLNWKHPDRKKYY